jgi:hypothetical protein
MSMSAPSAAGPRPDDVNSRTIRQGFRNELKGGSPALAQR